MNDDAIETGAPTPRRDAGRRKTIDIIEPERQASALVFASPHSGRNYPHDLIAATRLQPTQLRRSEDAYVDLLIGPSASAIAAPFLKALFPRTYVDVNRDARELDPSMFEDALPADVDSRSARVAAGLGAIARVVADGDPIYGRKLTYSEARRRLQTCYAPYHAALRQLIDRTLARFGTALLFDWHSMPSAGLPRRRASEFGPDIIIGDRFGASSAPLWVDIVEAAFRDVGFNTVRNAPYAGGFVANAYGRPSAGVHVVQVEINRALYLDEQNVAPSEGFETLRHALSGVVKRLARDAGDLSPGLGVRLSAAE